MQKGFDSKIVYLLTGLCLVFFVTAAYFFLLSNDLTKKLAAAQAGQENTKVTLEQKLAESTETLATAEREIEQLNKELGDTTEELEDTEDDLRKEKNKNDDFEDQIKTITNTVGDLDKLSKTDKELLQKYSKVYFLNENYIPSKIRQIDSDYILSGKDAQFFHGDAVSFLEDMIDDADDDDVTLKIVSAYRSFDHQQQLKGQYTQIYGSGANTFSADQGYSEHQLGTTLDITDPTTAGTYLSFSDSKAYEWLQENAYKYGFILSYPEGNSFYVFEPWHWRFVGQELATDLHRADAHFYDWEQRKIDEYLLNIFD